MLTDIIFFIKNTYFKKIIIMFFLFLRYLYITESYLKVHVVLALSFLTCLKKLIYYT
jgi:hypothetical protein